MEFNEKTVFPVFSKRDNDSYYHYISENCVIEITSKKAIQLTVVEDGLYILPAEVYCSKEEFIEVNKDLLQKTGLINLFEGADKHEGKEAKEWYYELAQRNGENHTLKANINQLKNENSDLRLQRNNAKENQIYYENINSELESEIFELKSLLKRYL
jgi:hypothetical protein